MVDSNADPLQVRLEREQTIREWQAESAKLKAMGYSSFREAQLKEGTLQVEKALREAAAGNYAAAWGDSYAAAVAARSPASTTSPNPNDSIPLINLTFGTKFGIAVVCMLLIGLAWVREKMKS